MLLRRGLISAVGLGALLIACTPTVAPASSPAPTPRMSTQQPDPTSTTPIETPSLTPTETPSPAPTETPSPAPSPTPFPVSTPEWTLLNSPDGVRELGVLGNLIFARTDQDLFRTEDGGYGFAWEPLDPGLPTGQLLAMDVDSGRIYVASRNGIIVSEDFGESFAWEFHWEWDSTQDVDFQDGFGWAAVDKWGSSSGPNRTIPGGSWTNLRGDIPRSDVSTSQVVADPLDPENIAYVGGIGSYRTLDGGTHWLPSQHRVLYSTVLDGTLVAFGHDSFSEDHGETWQPLGISARAFVKDDLSGLLFAAGLEDGVFLGQPGQWEPYGLSETSVTALAISGNSLFAVSGDGALYQMDIGQEILALASGQVLSYIQDVRIGGPSIHMGTWGIQTLLPDRDPILVARPAEYYVISSYDWSDNGSKLLYAEGTAIWEVDTCTWITTQVVGMKGDEQPPHSTVYIPGSSMIAFDTEEGLWTYDRASGDKVFMDDAVGYGPALLASPDGELVAYNSQTGDSGSLTVRSVADAEVVLRLTGYESVGGFDWASDSQRIAFQTGSDLYIADVETGDVVQFAHLDDLKVTAGPVWGLADSVLYFAAAPLNRPNISIADLSNVPPTALIFSHDLEAQLTSTIRELRAGYPFDFPWPIVSALSVSPDGTTIAFTEYQTDGMGGPKPSLWVMGPNGEDARMVAPTGDLSYREYRSLSWRPPSPGYARCGAQ